MAAPSETHGIPLPERLPSILEAFLDIVGKYPDNLAIASVHQDDVLFGIPSIPLDDEAYRQRPYLRWTFRNFREAISRFTAGLKEAGVKPGAPIFLFLTNCVEYAIARYSCYEIGCLLVPINPRNLANRMEVVHMLKTAMSVTPGKQTVVIVSNNEIAEIIDNLGLLAHGIKIVASTSGARDSWLNFERLMNPSHLHTQDEIDESADRFIDGIVLFTSGTTSLPKGCLKTYPSIASAVEAEVINADTIPDSLGPGTKYAFVLPNNHAMGELMIAMSHSVGSSVIFPGPGFQPDTMLETIYREKVTQHVNKFLRSIALVPTLVHALVGLKKARGIRLDNLVSVIFGGSMLTPEVLRLCLDELDAKGAESVFGMTEGIVIRPNSQRDLTRLVDGEDVTVGFVLPGAVIRIADPDTNQPVPRNSVGELQCSSPVCAPYSYIGDIGKDRFYKDSDGRRWVKSGDRARMDEHGRVFITGRYKDMIIRGGENISPSSIEAVLFKYPLLAALNPQIVAAHDTIAGDVPVLVLAGTVDGDVREAVRNAILENMGTIYLPDDVVSLHDLGLSNYPTTMGGKIKKAELAEIVKNYRADRDDQLGVADKSQLAAEVREVWARAVGLEPSRLSLETPIGEFADSITVMRVRDMIMRKTGRMLSLADMASAGTVLGHIELLEQAPTAATKPETKRQKREGPPHIDDMQHLVEDVELFEPTKELVTKTISPYGLDWNDVEDVLPAYDFANIMAETRLFDSWGLKFAILSKKSKTQLRRALETVLANNRILGSFLVRDKDLLESSVALHVEIRQNAKLFDVIIKDGGKVKSIQELKDKLADGEQPPAFPGPLTRAVLYDVEETGASGLLIFMNHAVVDASTGQIFNEDLDKALGGAETLSEHVDYKLWADSYYNLRTSPEARAATKWHSKRLKNLMEHKKAFWPPYSMPQSESDSIVKVEGEDVILHFFDVPAIQDLRRQHPHITATVVVKTAVALLNIFHTGHTHALFANLEAARTSFPFIPKTVEATGSFEATDVSGPTIQSVINLVEFRPEEAVLSLLERMQEEQLNLTKYASAPLREITTALGPTGNLIPEVIGHQLFNWVPGMGTTGTNPYENLEAIGMVARPYTGFVINAGLGGPDSNTIFLHIRGVSFNREAQKKLGVQIEKITLWLVAGENWNGVAGGFRDVLSGDKE